jgi:metallo-beta-lactamase family protein
MAPKNDWTMEFLGAAGTVTGSRTLLTLERSKILIDCGLFQGPRELRYRNWEPFPVAASKIERILLTHAHLDHTGYIPRLVKEGFRGEILCTEGTAQLCEVLWLDSAKLQEEDADFANRTGHSKHKPAYPLYGRSEVEAALRLLKPCKRKEWVQLSRSLAVRFNRAGHIPGASFIDLNFNQDQISRRICFSGDLGHDRSLTLREPESPEEADLLVLESTYGNRRHPQENLKNFAEKILNETFARQGTVVIPAFSVGRAQEILKLLQILESENRIPSVPVVLDSPMSVRATDIYLKLLEDQKPQGGLVHSPPSLFPKLFRTAESPDDSFAACMMAGPSVVISASGMLTGGRVLHHLKQRIQDDRNTILFSGYQAEGSKGRYLLDFGAKEGSVRIHHQEVPVRARIAMLEGLSAHGDFEDLGNWVAKFWKLPRKILLNHGEEASLQSFRLYLQKRFNVAVEIARPGQAYRL